MRVRGVLRSEAAKCMSDMLLEVTKELGLTSKQQRAEAKERNALIRSANDLERVQYKFQRAFIDKIFQSQVCADCGKEYDTLYPPYILALSIQRASGKWDGTSRCRPCAKQRMLKNHGGGSKRRCKHYGVPYEVISPMVIYRRDGFICQLCGQPVDISLPHTDPMSATLDHIHPLSLKIGWIKSPGHVPSNVQLAHWKCNIDKGAVDIRPVTFGSF